MSAEKEGAAQELVEVFDSQQESEAMVVKGLLESAGIEAIITGLDAPQDILPGVGGVLVRVAPDRAEEARRVIADFQGGGTPFDSDVGEEAGEGEGGDSAA